MMSEIGSLFCYIFGQYTYKPVVYPGFRGGGSREQWWRGTFYLGEIKASKNFKESKKLQIFENVQGYFAIF